MKYFEKQKLLILSGQNERAIYFAIGKLLRTAEYIGSQVFIEEKIKYIEAPEKLIRGQQLGYRPLNNTMDTWSTNDFKKYIEDLMLFGVNTINLISPNTDSDDLHAVQQWSDHCVVPKKFRDFKNWPHLKSSYEDHLKEVSEIIANYNLNSWLWYPNLGDFSSKNLKKQLNDREKIFKSMARIDVLFVPSGDPGELSPDELFSWLHLVYERLEKHHPKAKIWITLQSFQQAGSWLEDMIELIAAQPVWLGGVAHSPWQKISIEDLRKLIPSSLPIIHYADITHNLNCQFPVKKWEKAFAIAYGREAINPRSQEFKKIQNKIGPNTIGSVCYSEGVHDDVNKFVFSDQDWSSKKNVNDTLAEYSNIFIKEINAEKFSKYTLDLETNWNVAISNNHRIKENFTAIKKIFLKEVKLKSNFRFLLLYIRSISDLFIQNRLKKEEALIELCRYKFKSGAYTANDLKYCLSNIEYYLKGLQRDVLYKEILKISDRLFSVIGLQLSVLRHGNLAWNRGAFVDTLLDPITQVHEVKSLILKILNNDQEGLICLKKIKDFFYPDKDEICIEFKNHLNDKRAIVKLDPEDHSCDKSTFIHYSVQLQHLSEENKKKVGFVPVCWLSHVSTRFDTPLKIKLNELKPNRDYEMEITLVRQYFKDTIVSININETKILEKDLKFSDFVKIKNYVIKKEWIRKGSVELKLLTPSGHLGPNVAEIKLKPVL